MTDNPASALSDFLAECDESSKLHRCAVLMSSPSWGHKFLMATKRQERTNSYLSAAESQPLMPGEKSPVRPPQHLHPSTPLAPQGSLEGGGEDSLNQEMCVHLTSAVSVHQLLNTGM